MRFPFRIKGRKFKGVTVSHKLLSHNISSNLHLSNCLLIPSLSHKLLSISRLTKEVNCIVLMSSSDCVVQDALTGKIIGCGIERGCLYYVDETTQQSQAMLTRGSPRLINSGHGTDT